MLRVAGGWVADGYNARTVGGRSMIPHKTQRGAIALERLKAYEGVPPPYDKVKRAVVPDALKSLRLQTMHKFCTLGELAGEVGWKHGATVEQLEEKRKTRAGDYWKVKKASVQVCIRLRTAALPPTVSCLAHLPRSRRSQTSQPGRLPPQSVEQCCGACT
jgi:hypothetical protein